MEDLEPEGRLEFKVEVRRMRIGIHIVDAEMNLMCQVVLPWKICANFLYFRLAESQLIC